MMRFMQQTPGTSTSLCNAVQTVPSMSSCRGVQLPEARC